MSRFQISCSAALLALTACGEPPPSSRPNVLLLTVDTLRADHLGCYGYEQPTTPAIDALASGGTRFTRAQASSSWTLPGLASLLTSTYTTTNGCWRFDDALDASFATLAEALLSAGYETGAVASHVFLGTEYGLDQGFVHYDDDLVYTMSDSHQAVSSPTVSDKGIAFLEAAAGSPEERPWLLWLHYFDPHDTYLHHEGFTERFGDVDDPLALYDGEIAFTDRHIGRVLDAVERLGLTDDTLVVFTSDHGEEFGDHGGERHGHTLFGELVRVPLILRGPGIPVDELDAVVRTVDVLPTLLELCGVGPQAAPAGESLVPLLTGGRRAPGPALAELRLSAESAYDAVIDGPLKLIVAADGGEARLHDLAADPAETRDLAAERPGDVERLTAELLRLRDEALRASLSYEVAPDVELLPGASERLGHLGYGDGAPR
jgi:arylsulfatase A-like enzyme